MDEQQVYMVCMQVLEGSFQGANDMLPGCVVGFDQMLRPVGCDHADATFGDQLHLFSQSRLCCKGPAEIFFGSIMAIDIRVVKGGDTRVYALMNDS
jgi:hypothetical protein